MRKKMLEKLAYLIVTMVMASGWAVIHTSPALGDDAADTRQLVERSKLTFDAFVAAKDLSGLQDLLKKARGVFISPRMLEGAFVFGVSGGSGVFVARDPKTGGWNGPAFYTVGEVSFGLQAGGKDSQVIMLAMTERGVNALLSASFKLGGDVGVAAGPVGGGASAATANLSADIITYSLSKGLYGGFSLEGAVVAVRNSWNEAYYRKPGVTPTDILIRRDVNNPGSAKLIAAVSQATGGSEKARGQHEEGSPPQGEGELLRGPLRGYADGDCEETWHVGGGACQAQQHQGQEADLSRTEAAPTPRFVIQRRSRHRGRDGVYALQPQGTITRKRGYP